MAEYVDKEWVLKHLFFEVDRDLVRRAPDAGHVQNGTWESDGNDYILSVLYLVCKDCGSKGAEWMRYCPGCGRKMDGGG